MPDTNFRALCARLAEKIAYTWRDIPPDVEKLLEEVSAALAQPAPEPPTDKELDDLWAEIEGSGSIWSWQHYARAVLARWGQGDG
jgi:hypothetical protein